MRFITRVINIRGELFSSTFTYAASAAVRLVSSLVLTRILSPTAYGIFGILLSFTFIIDLASDVGFVALLIRHRRGSERLFVHTVWTAKLIRSTLNLALMFFGAPLIAKLYQIPELTTAFRVLSLQFVFVAAESMSFVLAQRNQRARIGNYAELVSGTISSVSVIAMAFALKNYFAFIYGVLLQRAILAIASHYFYRDVGVGIAFDREALSDQFRFARFVLPSSLLTILLSQYDKVVLLKLFDLSLLGVYGIAGNMLGPVTGIVMHNARVVLYARCAEYFRTDKLSARRSYYNGNARLLAIGVILPALLAGSSYLIIAVLYDTRYAMVAPILLIMGLGGILASFQNASENLLVASGRTQVVLICNVIRVFTVIPATLLGYWFFGLYGFLWGTAFATVPLLGYLFREQWKLGLLDYKFESRLFGMAALVFIVAVACSHALLAVIPAGWLHLGIKGH